MNKLSRQLSLHLIGVSSLIISEVSNAEWIYLADTPQGELLADKYDIYKTKDKAFFYTVLNYKKESNELFADYGMKVNSTASFNEIDCREDTVQVTQVIAFSKKYGTGAKVAIPRTKELETKVKMIVDSPISRVVKNACKLPPSRWSVISEFDGDNTLYVDFKSIVKDKGRTKLDVMFNFRDSELTKVKSGSSSISVDCSTSTYSISNVKSFSEAFLNGNVIVIKSAKEEVESGDDMQYPSAMGLIGLIVCNQITPLGDPTSQNIFSSKKKLKP
jgi:hypothetical protein